MKQAQYFRTGRSASWLAPLFPPGDAAGWNCWDLSGLVRRLAPRVQMLLVGGVQVLGVLDKNWTKRTKERIKQQSTDLLKMKVHSTFIWWEVYPREVTRASRLKTRLQNFLGFENLLEVSH